MSNRRNRRGSWLGVLAVVATLFWLVAGGIGDNLVYFLTPSEVLAQSGDVVGTPIRLAGRVAAGTVQWDAEALDLRFRVEDEQESIAVRSEGAPPQMFHEGIDVVLEGVLDEAGTFQAHNLMVKHSNEYGPEEGAPSRESLLTESGVGG